LINENLKFFYEGWLKKASDYKTDILSDSFDKFFTVFVAYNALYNEAARRLVSSGRIRANDDRDKKSATVHAPAHIGHGRMANVIKGDNIAPSKLKEITELIKNGTFCIHLNKQTGQPNHSEDMKHIKRIENGNDQEFCESLMILIYKTRCNMFHGGKEYNLIQLRILNPMTYVLELVAKELFHSLESDST